MTCVVVVCTGGGGGGAACVVVVCTGGGGGGGAACVVVVCTGVGVLLGAVGTAVARALWTACRPFSCFLALCLGFGLAAVVVVAGAGVDWVVDVLLVAAALWFEVDDEAPQALTMSMSRTAARAMRRYLMTDSPTPRIWWLVFKDANPRGLLPGKSGSGRCARLW